MSLSCCWCNGEITNQQIKENEAQELMGVWSHIKCDEKQLDKIDKNMKVIKIKNNFEL